MPRVRTGTLVPPGRDGIHRARFTKDNPDGTTSRPFYSLGTTDLARAKRELARVNAVLAAGGDIESAGLGESTPELVRGFVEAWLEKREAAGVVNVEADERNLRTHALRTIGHLPVVDVKPPHVTQILEGVATGTYKRAGKVRHYGSATVAKVRALLHGLFRSAHAGGLIESNPVDPVISPKTRETQKARCILTDEEFSTFIACPHVDLELRMLALVARVEGGMRAGDLNAWDWTMIDRLHFSECFVPRAKTRRPQLLVIPEVLAPFLRAWWERAGKPEGGPVFPVRAGKRVGGFRESAGGFAYRLRRELFRAGVYRMPPVQAPATKRGQRTDLDKPADGTKPAPNPRDPLYFETAMTRPVDWHSFRRAFGTALAEAGVNVQHSMHLSAHGDAKVHARYVMATKAMRTIPTAAIPELPAGGLPTSDSVPRSARSTDACTPHTDPETIRDESSRRPVNHGDSLPESATSDVAQRGARTRNDSGNMPFTRTKSQVQILLRPPVSISPRSALFTVATALLGCSGPPEDVVGNAASAIEMGSPATMYPEAVYVLGGGFIPCSGVVLAPRVVLTAGHCGTSKTTYVVTAPHADNQVAHGVSGWSPFTGNAAKTPDVRLIFLDTPIQLASYPVLSKAEVSAGTRVVDIGRTRNGSINDNDYVSPPVEILGTATKLGFPFNYEADPDISQDGDSGGPIELIGAEPHTVVAIVDTDTVEQGISETTPIDMFARLDVVATEIQAEIAAQDRDAGPAKDAGKDADIGSGAMASSAGGGGCSVARVNSRCDACLTILLLPFALRRRRAAKA
jgi:integrase